MASSATALYEKLGVFYLGKPYDLPTQTLGTAPVLYDSKDLVTHAVIVGMTGSGKTGLGLSLIEEAAIDGVPVLAIDPKGDLGNLLLTFPNLAAGDFKPWVDADEATRRGISVDAFAEQEAATWKKGLEAWGQDGERIARLRAATDFAIYTPGSRAGRGRARGHRAHGRSGDDDGDQRPHPARRRRRPGAEPRAHPALRDPERRVVQG